MRGAARIIKHLEGRLLAAGFPDRWTGCFREPRTGTESLLPAAFRMLVSNSALHDTSTFDPFRQPSRWPYFRAGNFVEK